MNNYKNVPPYWQRYATGIDRYFLVFFNVSGELRQTFYMCPVMPYISDLRTAIWVDCYHQYSYASITITGITEVSEQYALDNKHIECTSCVSLITMLLRSEEEEYKQLLKIQKTRRRTDNLIYCGA